MDGNGSNMVVFVYRYIDLVMSRDELLAIQIAPIGDSVIAPYSVFFVHLLSFF